MLFSLSFSKIQALASAFRFWRVFESDKGLDELIGYRPNIYHPWLATSDPRFICRGCDNQEAACAGAADGFYIDREDAVLFGRQRMAFHGPSTVIQLSRIAEGCPCEKIMRSFFCVFFWAVLQPVKMIFVEIQESFPIDIDDDKVLEQQTDHLNVRPLDAIGFLPGPISVFVGELGSFERVPIRMFANSTGHEDVF